MTLTTCPRCSRPRIGTERFCSNCGLDYWQASVGTSSPEVPPSAPTPSPRSRSWLLPALVVGIVLVIVIGIGLQNTSDRILSDVSDEIGGGIDYPPAGDIWFGSTFDVETLELSGRTRTVGASESFALVGALPRAMDADDLAIRASVDGEVVRVDAFTAEGNGDLWGFTYNPLVLPGTWTIEYTDVGGNVQASGELEVTE